MTKLDIAKHRLINQHILRDLLGKPDDVVRWLGAIQAQNYLAALWAVGLRVKNTTEIEIEQAIRDKTIVRTWLLRGTLHFVAAEDVKWLLELIAPRITAGRRSYMQRLNLDDDVFAHSKEVLTRALQGGEHLTRKAMYNVLDEAHISTADQRGLHILWRLALEGLICFGPREGKQQTFVLLDEWLPDTKSMGRIEALTELASRYFTSHGPATIQDFTWWSGLTAADARAGLKIVKSKLVQEEIGGNMYWSASKSMPLLNDCLRNAYLLPSFDEYLIAYKDRSASLNALNAEKLKLSNGLYSTVVINGRVVGTWKRTFKKDKMLLMLILFKSLSEEESQAVNAAVKQYGQFVDMPTSVKYNCKF